MESLAHRFYHAGGHHCPARAEVIVVNNLGDNSDEVAAGSVCDIDTFTPGLHCTLRAAIEHANVNSLILA